MIVVNTESPVNELSYGRPNWFDRVKEEHEACRENVALFDMSAFTKLEVEVTELGISGTVYIVTQETCAVPT